MRTTPTKRAALGVLVFSAALLLPNSPTVAADDAALFSTSVAPNVMLMVDNSGSMNNIVWHPEFDADGDPSCDHYVDEATYIFNSELTLTRCDNERTLYPDTGITGWTQIYGKYLNWIFSDEASSHQAEIAATNNGTRSQCLINEGCDPVSVRRVLSPPWTTDWISEEGREKLRDYGIAPPDRASGKRALFGRPEVHCPRCGSDDTTLVSEFGSTACKASYKCAACLEPFEYFKCI